MSEEKNVAVSREITIYATKGGEVKKITTDVQTWGELMPLVRKEGFDLNSLLAAENINKADLVNTMAVLPTVPFRLFLRPKQVKSGAPDRKECFAIVKAHLAKHPEDKDKFTVNGNNVTRLATPVVQDLVAKYCSGTTVPTGDLKPTPKKEVVEKVKEVVESVKESKASCVVDITELEEALEKAKASYKKAVANDLDEETQDMLLEKISKAKAALKVALETPAEPVESAEDIAKRKADEEEAAIQAEIKKKAAARIEAEEKEKADLAAEARALSSGY